MHDLTQRQINILKNIVKDYIDTAESVGSETLEKKHDLGVSPATIRNEMAEMEKLGYLVKSHISSGRVPTSKALKLYVDELMKEKELSIAEQVEVKDKVWDLRENESKFLKEITRALAGKTRALAVSVTDEHDMFSAGYPYILEMPEFFDIDVTRNLLSILDESDLFDNIIIRIEKEFGIFLGDEFESEIFKPYSFVFSRFITKRNHGGSIGIVGPQRLHYDNIVPVVKYFGDLIKEVAEW